MDEAQEDIEVLDGSAPPLSEPASKPVSKVSQAPKPLPSLITSSYGGHWHLALILILILEGSSWAGTFFHEAYWLNVSALLLFVTGGISFILALIKQNGSSLSPLTKKCTWVSMAHFMISSIIFSINIQVLTFQYPETHGEQYQLLMKSLKWFPSEGTYVWWATLIKSISALAFGGLALFSFRRLHVEPELEDESGDEEEAPMEEDAAADRP